MTRAKMGPKPGSVVLVQEGKEREFILVGVVWRHEGTAANPEEKEEILGFLARARALLDKMD